MMLLTTMPILLITIFEFLFSFVFDNVLGFEETNRIEKK